MAVSTTKYQVLLHTGQSEPTHTYYNNLLFVHTYNIMFNPDLPSPNGPNIKGKEAASSVSVDLFGDGDTWEGCSTAPLSRVSEVDGRPLAPESL